MIGFAFAPLVVLALLVAALRTGRRDTAATLREDILAAALLLGVAIALGTQVLSAFRAISPGALLGFWSAAMACAVIALAWRWRRSGPPAPVPIPALGAIDGLLVGGVVAIALLLLAVAWFSPPQSSDSIGYHMSRVMHWIQNRSIEHYPTPDAPQLFEPPFAEIVRLHLQLLTGGDRAGCLLQWFAAMGSLAAGSLLARDLGGARRAQFFAAVFAVTLPIGAAQASSGKNGWVEALWLLCLVHFSGIGRAHGQETLSPGRTVAAFAALGLELMTKITGWLFAAPFVLVAVVQGIRMSGSARRRLVTPVAAGALLVCALAGPYLARNFEVYGHPLADPVFRAKSGLQITSPAVVVSNVVRNASFQFGTTSAEVNQALMRSVAGLHRFLGVDSFDPRTSQFGPFRIRSPNRVEELVFSPMHIFFLFAVAAALLVSRRLRGGSSRVAYLVALFGGYLLFCATVKFQPPGCRLLMPLLVLAAPLVAVVVSDASRARLVPAISAILFVASLPYAAAVQARPLSFERGRGILVTPRSDLYFARVPWLRRTYLEAARFVQGSRTQNLGVVFTDSGHPEYLLWVLLKDADPPVRIENVMVTDASGTLASLPPFQDFRPERVIVFASGPGMPGFDPEIVAAGTRMALARGSGMAGFYVPVTEGRAR